MRQASWSLFLGTVLLPLILFAAAPNQTLTTQMITATPRQTVVEAEFDQFALHTRLSGMELGDHATEGLGIILGIAGHGNPVAHVQNYELGDEVQTSTTLAAEDIASSSDELTILGQPAVFHDLRIVPLNYRPVMRDGSGALRAVRRIRAEVVTGESVGPNETDDPVSLSSAFAPLYHTLVSNLDDYISPDVSLRGPGRFLVVMNQTRLNSIGSDPIWQNWVDLKRRKGYQMQIMGITNPTTATAQAAIQNAYNDHAMRDIEYVMIVGTYTEFPPYYAYSPDGSASSVGDNPYFCLAGNDSLPDVFGGRVAAATAQWYATYFSKVYGYETNPYTDDMRWFQSVTCVAGNYSDGDGTFPVTPVWNVNWARDRMMRDNCITNADTFYIHTASEDPNGWRVPIRQDIDSGVCAVLYRGWGGSQCWQYPVWCNSDIDQLNNYRRTPAVFAIVCGSGNFGFTNGPCLGQEFTTGVGSVSQPKGAIIFIGASDLHTNTRQNNANLSGIIEAMMEGGVRSGGALLVAGKLEGWRQYPHEQGHPSPAYYYILHVFNLLGDPETQIYVCTPGTLSITNPGQLTVGQTLVPITVQSGGQPVPDAVVTLRTAGSTNVASVMTDGSGQAYVPASFTVGDTAAELTVWKARYFMRWITIPIGRTGFDPKITAVNWSDSNDNLPNPGETENFTLSVQNTGTAAATLTATVTSLDSRITVPSGSATVPTLQPGETANSTTLTISLGGSLFNGERPRLSVLLQDGSNNVTRQVEVPVAAPALVIRSVRVADGNNGILEPGEANTPIYITAVNRGGQDGSNITVTVSSFDNAITFNNTQASWTSIPINQAIESNTAFNATLANGVTPGRQILLRFDVSQNGVACGWSSYLLPTGVVTIHAPTGPDAYGYYAYEDIDNGYAATPTYNWIELNPDSGGNGDAHAVHDDSHFAMALPAPFTYYGQSFGNIWICSNGWFSFEPADLPEFRNWELPSPIGPPSLVAPYWTDLLMDRAMPNDDSLGYVWTRYDAGQSRFIIEWQAYLSTGMHGGNPNTFNKFEAILEYRSSTDGNIVFQYKVVTLFDGSNPHGNYFTTGWEDSYHQRGLTLAYADMFPASVDTMRAGRAIRVTTQAPDNFNSVGPTEHLLPKQFALHEAFPNPFNPVTELRFDLPNAGRTTLRVYDMLGREVATLLDEHRVAGTYTVSFDATNLPSGLYFARLTSGTNVQVRKLMLVK